VFALLVVMTAPMALDVAAPAPVFAQEDAWVFAQEDAWVFAQEDAWVFAQEDAWVFAQEDARQPAVVVSEESGQAEDQAWTFRFLVPTVLAIAVLALGATLLVYALRVRGRYRVVR
jgi:hypothetical protein